MGREKIPIPMLDEFLQHIKAPAGNYLPEWLDWPVALLVFAAISQVGLKDAGYLLALIPAIGVFQGLRAYRSRQISNHSPALQAKYERWQKIKPLVEFKGDKRIYDFVPTPVLASLERAARTWHDAREQTYDMIAQSPELGLDVRQTLDDMMVGCVACARPVVLREDQGRKDLRRLEEDAELMTRICLRIESEEARMVGWSDRSSLQQDDLRQRLEEAKAERARAEAELDALI